MIPIKFYMICCLAVALSYSCGHTQTKYIDLNANGKMDVYENPQETPQQRAKDLVDRLTLKEKASLMGSNAVAVPRLGIQAFGWDNEGKHAIVTCFPTSIGLAATWDTQLLSQTGSALGDEGRIMSRKDVKAGKPVRWLSFWAPTINMARDPRWGRTMETFSEDPYLTSTLAIPFIRGMQGTNSRYLKAIAGVNHFAAYSRELGRHELNAVVSDEKQLREYYLESFRQCVAESKNAGIGASNNALNGVPACGNRWLLTNVLRDEWNYQGYVFSDAASVSDIAGIRKYLPTNQQAVALTVKAGCDIDCGNTYQDFLGKAIDEKKLDLPTLDSSLIRSFTIRFRLGLFDPAGLNPYEAIPDTLLDGQKHRQLALAAARSSIVLLKNDHGVLPLVKTVKNIVLAGPRADKPELGRKQFGHSISNISALQGIRNRFKNANVLYSQDIEKSLVQARSADVIVYCTSLMEGEVSDRLNLRLSSRQEDDILRLARSGKPVIVVLYSGSTVDVSPWINKVDGLIEAWYPGEEGGNALADVLAGNYNPSGKLPVTFYKSINDLPPFEDFDITKGRTYQFEKHPPRYPFGFGLSYTTFQIRLNNIIRGTGQIRLKATVKNTGRTDGTEVVQVYMSFKGDKSRAFPAKQLKGFSKQFLKAGESKEVQFVIKEEDMAFYDNAMNYKIFAGNYSFQLGNSSANIQALANIDFHSENILKKGPEIIYHHLKVAEKNVKAGDTVTVDVDCENKGDVSGRPRLLVDGQPFYMVDSYIGPRRREILKLRVPLMGAIRHEIAIPGQASLAINVFAGYKSVLISALRHDQLVIAGQNANFSYLVTNNGIGTRIIGCSLKVNGEISSTKQITLIPGKPKTIKFSHVFKKAGIYQVVMNDECRSDVLAGEKVKPPFLTTESLKGGFYQVNDHTSWGESSGSVGGTPISMNYGEHTANDSYGAVFIPGGMGANSMASVRILQQERTGNYAKVGIMIRNHLNQPGRSAGYCIASVASYYGGGGLFEWDSHGGGFLDSLRKIELAPFPNKWIRIERHQSLFIVWTSKDGQHWRKQQQTFVPGTERIQDVGVFVTSDDPTKLCKVIFSDFHVSQIQGYLKETDRDGSQKKENIFTTEPL
jgi:beta-glucosidase